MAHSMRPVQRSALGNQFMSAVNQQMSGSKRNIKHTYNVRYVTAMKSRPGGFSSVCWLQEGRWGIVIPRDVLFNWFNVSENKQTEVPEGTVYEVLALPATAAQVDIRPAYKRLVRQWHPDVCKDLGAREMFDRIQSAYRILSDQNKRKKYDAILKWRDLKDEDSYFDKKPTKEAMQAGYWATIDYWRPPLRCGEIEIDGYGSGKWFVASRILSWDDIVNGQGQVLVSSWVDNKLEERWS